MQAYVQHILICVLAGPVSAPFTCFALFCSGCSSLYFSTPFKSLCHLSAGSPFFPVFLKLYLVLPIFFSNCLVGTFLDLFLSLSYLSFCSSLPSVVTLWGIPSLHYFSVLVFSRLWSPLTFFPCPYLISRGNRYSLCLCVHKFVCVCKFVFGVGRRKNEHGYPSLSPSFPNHPLWTAAEDLLLFTL